MKFALVMIVTALLASSAAARPGVVRSTRLAYVQSRHDRRAPGGGRQEPRQPPTIPVPPVLQHSDAACGPASLQSVLSYYGLEVPHASRLVRLALPPKRGASGYTYEAGTPEATLGRLARQAGLRVRSQRNMSLGALVQHVARGTPVIVGYQAWATNPARVDWKRDTVDGHYSVVIGFGDRQGRRFVSARDMRRASKRDQANVLVWLMDPYKQFGKRGYIPLGEFLERWHWPGASHYGMVLEPGPTTGKTRLRVHVESVGRIY